MWTHKNSGILNSFENSEDKRALSSIIERLPIGPINFVSASEVSLLASELGCNMSFECDGIPSDFYKMSCSYPFTGWQTCLMAHSVMLTFRRAYQM